MQDSGLLPSPRVILFYIVIFGVVLMLIGTEVLEIPKLVILQQRGVVIEGQITGYDAKIRRTRYRYRFDNVDYEGDEVIKPRSPEPGTRWIVTVDPQMPTRHTSGLASDSLFLAVKILGFLSVALLIGGIFNLARQMGRKNRTPIE